MTITEFIETLRVGGCAVAEDRIRELIRDLEGTKVPEDECRRLLHELRSRRCFALMTVVCPTLVAVAGPRLSVFARLQWSQACIELGDYEHAQELLDTLQAELGPRGNRRGRSEVLGLRGRLAKQRFVDACRADRANAEGYIRSAIEAYESAFELDPAWHGANLVALVARAEREGITVQTDASEIWADRLLEELNDKPHVEWTAWDSAAAAEACLAKRDQPRVIHHLRRYCATPLLDQFALAGTHRQLREIWQLDPQAGEFEAAVLSALEAWTVQSANRGLTYSPQDLRQLEQGLRSREGVAEALFGRRTIPLRKVLRLLRSAEAVCQVTLPLSSDRSGTGFLVDGRQLSPALDERAYLLTNHHVLHGDEATEQMLAHEDYQGSIHITEAVARFHYWDGHAAPVELELERIVAYSPSDELDFSLVSLKEPLPAERCLRIADGPLNSRYITAPSMRSRIFVVGHPGGGDLSFSLANNEVLDHQLGEQDEPIRRIHYGAPTAGGSSGSPVFHEETLAVLGLHRRGNATALMPDPPRQDPGQKYSANEAVAMRSIREHVQQCGLR